MNRISNIKKSYPDKKSRPRLIKLFRKKLIEWPKNALSKNWKNKTKILLKTICLTKISLK